MDFSYGEKIMEYCMSKDCAYETRPFGKFPICYKVSGKIFAQLNLEEEAFRATVKTNPDAAMFYRDAYPDVVVRGYHCPPVQQSYWNTIDLYRFDFDTLCNMIDEAYKEVVIHLTKKEQLRLPMKKGYNFVKTDGENLDFRLLCLELDENLDEIVGNKFDRTPYAKYNSPETINDVLLIYKGDELVGGGAYRFYDDTTVEIKRVFLRKQYRGIGLSKELLLRLEADAKISGFKYAILETGEPLVEATNLYRKIGYKIIPNYGQYADMPESICMQKKL